MMNDSPMTLPQMQAYMDEMVRKAKSKLDWWNNDIRLSYSSWRNFKQCPLKGVLGLSAAEVNAALDAAGIDGGARAETLEARRFLALGEALRDRML